MGKLTIRFYLISVGLYFLCVVSLVAFFGAANSVAELTASGSETFLSTAAAWLTGTIGRGLATLLLLLLTLIIAALTLLFALNLAFGGGAHAAVSSSSTLAGADVVLSLLEPLLPTRTMIEVGGDVRERIALLHDQGASLWEIRRQFAAGLLFILLEATRETLASRRKKRG